MRLHTSLTTLHHVSGMDETDSEMKILTSSDFLQGSLIERTINFGMTIFSFHILLIKVCAC